MSERRTAEGKAAKIEYIAAYNNKMYDNTAIRLPKGEKERYKEEAATRGMSFAGFIVAALDEYIANHPVS